jgi:hypothetical protein
MAGEPGMLLPQSDPLYATVESGTYRMPTSLEAYWSRQRNDPQGEARHMCPPSGDRLTDNPPSGSSAAQAVVHVTVMVPAPGATQDQIAPRPMSNGTVTVTAALTDSVVHSVEIMTMIGGRNRIRPRDR